MGGIVRGAGRSASGRVSTVTGERLALKPSVVLESRAGREGRGRAVGAVLAACLMAVLALGMVSAASAGAYNTVYAWDSNSNTAGELGNGTEEASALPVPVCAVGATAPCTVPNGNVLSGVTAVAAGNDLGPGLALLGNETVVAWGSNAYGDLGDGTNTGPESCINYSCSTTPVAVCAVGQSSCTPTSNELTGVTAISAGGVQGVALLQNERVVDWGWNSGGELGDGSNNPSFVPVEVCAVGATAPCEASRNNVLEHVKAISAGVSYNLALLSSGRVVAWGANLYGALGNDGPGITEVPVEVCAVGATAPCEASRSNVLENVTAISAGNNAAVAVLNNGELRTWGENLEGELGDGESGHPGVNNPSPERTEPVPVCAIGPNNVTCPGGPYLTGAVAAGAGADQTLALLGNEQALSWGNDADGELGNGTETGPNPCWAIPNCNNIPAAVLDEAGSGPLEHINAISAGGAHDLALMSNQTLTAWGEVTGTTEPFFSSDLPVGVCAPGGTAPCSAANSNLLGGVSAISAGGEDDFAVAPAVPSFATLLTGEATSVTATTAVLHASADANGEVVSGCELEYGTSNNPYSSSVPCSPTPTGTSRVEVPASLTGLTPGTTYHYRVVATTPAGTSVGKDATFMTMLTSSSATSNTPNGTASVSEGSPVTLSATASGGEGTVTIGTYAADPVGQPSLDGNSSYVDIRLSPGSTFTSLEIKDCELNGATKLEFWGRSGKELSGWTVIGEPPALYEPGATPQPCITLTLTASTTPDLEEMEGTVFTGRVPAGPQPKITKLSAKKGPAAGGTPVTISGSDFAGVSAVKFGGSEATKITYHSATSITALSPAASTGAVEVSVVTPNGTTAVTPKAKFTFEAPTVTAVSPGAGPLAGGTATTITGTGFAIGSSTVFKFAKNLATSVSCTTTTTCTADAPAGKKVGTVDVRAAANGKTSKKNPPGDHFEYR